MPPEPQEKLQALTDVPRWNSLAGTRSSLPASNHQALPPLCWRDAGLRASRCARRGRASMPRCAGEDAKTCASTAALGSLSAYPLRLQRRASGRHRCARPLDAPSGPLALCSSLDSKALLLFRTHAGGTRALDNLDSGLGLSQPELFVVWPSWPQHSSLAARRRAPWNGTWREYGRTSTPRQLLADHSWRERLADRTSPSRAPSHILPPRRSASGSGTGNSR